MRRATNPHLKMADQTDYNKWTKTGLIQKLRQLETELKRRPAAKPEPVVENEPQEPTPGTTKPKEKRKMDPSKYSTRYIALKLAYLGKNYGGFEFQSHGNEPSIEEELWNALTKACLIFPEDDKIVDWECCEYSKCGRTDRGVSAFGQVIGIRVRSNRPLPKKRVKLDENGAMASPEGEHIGIETAEKEQEEEEAAKEEPFDDFKDEIPYPHLLNRLLPADIRILAWCPNPPPEFSARFSCRERQYRYFFTQPAFSPDPTSASAPVGNVKPGWLDIEAMRDAAKRFEGEQDFRNVCKIDPAKLITNWSRTIFESDIVEVKDARSALSYLKSAGFSPADLKDEGGERYPRVYYFHVRGSAFLWHQIRHMVALLFLVGQGLESPSLITKLLDVAKNPRRPNYVMADEVPLVLWDCIFPDLNSGNGGLPRDGKFKDTLQWVHVGGEGASQGKTGQFGQWGVMDGMWRVWREKKMDELLANQLLQQMATQIVPATNPESAQSQVKQKGNVSVRLFEGGNTGRQAGKYVPVLKKDKLESADELNDKYAKRKGYADAAAMRAQKSSRMNRVEGEDE